MPKASFVKSLTIFSRKEAGFLFKKARRVLTSPLLDIKRAPYSLEAVDNSQVPSLELTEKHGRILLIIPRAVGTAPIRNKIRRRLKHIFFEEQLFNAPYNWIIIVKPAAAQATYEELLSLLKKSMAS